MASKLLPPGYATTRASLHRVAVHVLARARHAADGRIGLRPSPNGFATPAFGPGATVLRVARDRLLVEEAGPDGAYRTRLHTLHGATLADLAGFAGVDLSTPLDVGTDTPPLGEIDEPIEVDADAGDVAAGAWTLGWVVLDSLLSVLDASAEPSVIQLWPEHFDLAVDIAVGDGRVNVGVSPGDSFHEAPYLYVGPWGPARPGDRAFWNAPFGAFLSLERLSSAPNPFEQAGAFLAEALRYLRGG